MITFIVSSHHVDAVVDPGGGGGKGFNPLRFFLFVSLKIPTDQPFWGPFPTPFKNSRSRPCDRDQTLTSFVYMAVQKHPRAPKSLAVGLGGVVTIMMNNTTKLKQQSSFGDCLHRGNGKVLRPRASPYVVSFARGNLTECCSKSSRDGRQILFPSHQGSSVYHGLY